MSHHKHVPKPFWAEELAVATYVRNRVTTRGLSSNVTPFELWNGKKHNLAHLREFGSKFWFTIRSKKRKKTDARAREALMIGYAKGSRGCKLRDAPAGKIFVSRDVRFDQIGNVDSDSPNADNAKKVNFHVEPPVSISLYKMTRIWDQMTHLRVLNKHLMRSNRKLS